MTETILWSSVYLPLADRKQVMQALQAIHTAAGYVPYNPYPGGMGTPSGVTEMVKLFVAPLEKGWIRLIGQPNPSLLPELAQQLGCSLLYIWINTTNGQIDCIGSGELSQFLRPDKTPADLQNALSAAYSDPPSGGVLGDLASSHGVDVRQADRLFQKTSRTVLGKLDRQSGGEASAMQTAASGVLSGNDGFSWKKAAAQRVQGVMACLTVPENWRDPDYKDLAAAYQIACLLDQDENALLLPSDEAILDKVEFPLDYRLAYFAR
jgi:hypothetical protein